ncbi:hypothetical protein MNEG_13953 [Monoraphidium neglectum]|uniref:Uncharacterized protein n=1 Tax=Monoraphidium neglectum TaxID=145388 RepID=A0A0D2MFY6_9CHLO|nr:hypothetical protein MNEG_13953 [Monoraphidium neglectum]KIY94010.1 hypothetical protein MNEG_13953 [Monoraphidium neglectum]|eukprot:XP_013893030.1 hypothetical protein MNEG_13953 [Monoraphidium neglectum]
MEEMADQQFKQMLLAYTLLLLNQGPMHIDDLDNDCEELLVKEFDSRIDFQVTDALPRLQRWGLVSCNDRDELSACPLTDAIDTLTAAWTIAYKALGGGHASSISTYDLLTGKASTFGAGLDQWRKDKAHLQALTSASEADAKRGVFGKAKNVLGFGKGRGGNLDADGGSEGGLGTEGGSVASGAELEEGGSGGEKKKKFSLKKLLA